MKLYLMVGCPGSGKSTFAKNELMNNNTHYVSRDSIRFHFVTENEPYFSQEKIVFKTFVDEINYNLNVINQDVIADATHLNEVSRTKLLKALKIDHKKVQVIAIHMKADFKTCLRNNEKRAGTRSYVPPEVLRKMYNALSIVNLNREKDIDSLWEINYYYKEKQAGN